MAQYLADKDANAIVCVAPAEGNHPIDVLANEAASFPCHFVTGINTFLFPRPKKITLKKYLNVRLFSSDTRFACYPDYIFWAQYCSDYQDVFSSCSIALRKSGNTDKIDANTLLDTRKLTSLLKKDECYRFLNKVRGSPPYWEKTTKDLFAMLRQLGIPTFFLTLSAADRKWTEFIEAICIQNKRDIPHELDYQSFYQLMNDNIVTATRMFDKRLRDFLNIIVKGPSQPLGKVIDYFGRIEFQARGWPHWHGILWIEGAPIYGVSPIEDVIAFIDAHISAERPDPLVDQYLFDLVNDLQSHKNMYQNWEDLSISFSKTSIIQHIYC